MGADEKGNREKTERPGHGESTVGLGDGAMIRSRVGNGNVAHAESRPIGAKGGDSLKQKPVLRPSGQATGLNIVVEMPDPWSWPRFGWFWKECPVVRPEMAHCEEAM